MSMRLNPLLQPIPFTVDAKTSIRRAIALMDEHHTSYVLIEKKGQLQGIATSSDFLRWMASGQDSQETAIAHIMTQPLITGTLADLESATALHHTMHQHQIHHLPIVDSHHQLHGIVTQSSVCAALQDEFEHAKKEFESQYNAQRVINQRLEMALEVSGHGVCEFDMATGDTAWNDRYSSLLGLDPKAVQPSYETFKTQVHPDDWNPVHQALLNAAEAGTNFSLEFRVQRPNGGIRWIRLRGCDRDAGFNRPQYMVGVATDITDQKRVEDALKLSEAKNRAVLNAIPDLLSIYRSDGVFQEVIRQSNSLQNLIDVLPPTVNPIGQHVTQILPPEVAEKKLEGIQRAIATGNVQSYEQVISLNDAVQYEDIRISPVDDETVLVMVRDIGERKHHEESLRRYERIFHTTGNGMVLIDRNYRYQLVNQTYLDWHQCSNEEIAGLHIRHVLGDDLFDHSLKPKLDQCLQGETLQFEKWSKFATPHPRYLSIHYSPYREINGTIAGVVVTIQDLTDLKQTTEALEKSEAENRAILEALPDLLIRVNYHGEIRQYVKPATCDTHRYLYAKKHLSEVLDTESLNIELGAVQKAIDTHRLQVCELQLRKEGRQTFEDIRVARIDDHDALIIVRDITERKQIEAEKRRSQEALEHQMNFLQSVIDAIPSFVFVKNRCGKFLLANRAVTDIYTESPISIIGKKDRDLNPNTSQVEQFLELNQEVMDTGQTRVSNDQLITDPTGGARWYQTSVSPWVDMSGTVVGVIGNCVEITERKQLEIALQQSEAQLQTILASIGAAVRYFRFFPTGQWEALYCSQKCKEFFSCSDDEAFTEYWLAHIQHDDVDRVVQAVQELMSHDRQICIEYRFRCSDGSIRWISDTLTSHWDDEQESWFVTAVAIDISDRQRIAIERHVIEDALRQENQFRSQIIDQMAEGLCVCYEVNEFPHVQFSVWNQHMTEITGYTMAEINAGGWYQSLYPDPDIQARAIKRMADMRRGHDLRNEEWVISRADGQYRTVSLSTTLLDIDSGSPLILAVMQDVSDRKQAEFQLQQSLQEKNLLLSEVHHRVKNNLQVIISLLTLQANRVHDSAARHALKQASDRVHAIALVHEKLYRTQHFEGISLSDYIQEFVDQLVQTQERLDSPITTHYALDSSIHLPLVKAIQVSLILNEFVTNAMKHGETALNGKHTIYVELTQQPNTTIALRVGNHGSPLPPDFSLTAPRDSMGLRLIQVLAEQISGSIQVESKASLIWFTLMF
ncbi:MAG: PAS domain S-box protein [Leptolyngbyaceae bacterium]|nr:PAS domain S-box protein [Leptolyngbyaceae bacterium]